MTYGTRNVDTYMGIEQYTVSIFQALNVGIRLPRMTMRNSFEFHGVFPNLAALIPGEINLISTRSVL